MLQRMFIRWAESHNFIVTILDESSGDEAGIKSCLMSIEGDYVYGRLRSERGVHRLVVRHDGGAHAVSRQDHPGEPHSAQQRHGGFDVLVLRRLEELALEEPLALLADRGDRRLAFAHRA